MESWTSWIDLPELALIRVFQSLDYIDRVKAAHVSQKWYQVMHSPALWRKWTFTFCERRTRLQKSYTESAIWCAQKFGKYVEHLEIIFLNSYSTKLTKKFQVTLRTLLACIGKQNTGLKSLTISYLGFNCVGWLYSIINRVLRSLTFFLRRRDKHLQYFRMRDAGLRTEQGCAILASLCHQRESSSVKELDIIDFFGHHISVYANPLFVQTLSKFQNLSVLSLNYCCISDDVLNTLSQKCSQSLLVLRIKCHIYDAHQQIVSGIAWSNLTKNAPNLSVRFYFAKMVRYDCLTRILAHQIPLESLYLLTGNFNEPNWKLKSTLTELIPTFKCKLQKLTVVLNNRYEPLDSELLHLALVCKNLYYLKIWAYVGIRLIEDLLQLKQDGESNLSILKVREEFWARIYTHSQNKSDEEKLLQEIVSKYLGLIDEEKSYFHIAETMM
ncbi:F-box only protein 39 [Protopterus annectens]|uniref:F-box only protein 39 n=1 Tax=Protopterus annectens TaxID=7888 RepID=UPI001CFA28C8|nr:F-box only protein 39 [Protopterus annectens]